MLSSKVRSLQKQLSEVAEHPPLNAGPEGKSQATHSVEELERVISAMKKVIEKLQVENETLKRNQSASRPAQTRTEGGRKLAALQEENSKMKVI